MAKKLYFKRSTELFERARKIIPGGVNSPVRAFRSVGGKPIYYRCASGSRFVDVDGNEFIDFCMSWGPLILGHCDEDVVEAVSSAASRGLSFGACHEAEIEFAGLILEGFPDYDMVRVLNSGTEAVMTAIRIARGWKSRDLVVKFNGCYHGHSDCLLVKSGSGLATFGISSTDGVPAGIAQNTISLPLDDEEALQKAFEKYSDRIACVIIEPLPANSGLLPQRKEFLRFLREITAENGAILIFDEVISGFRFCFGGYGKWIGVSADLVTLGKIIGGGMPIGGVVGKAELMELLAPAGKVYQAGTLSGNPVALAAGIATLKKLKESQPYEHLEALGKRFEEALGDKSLCVRRGSVIWLNLAGGRSPRKVEEINPASIERYNKVFHHVIESGFYIPPSGYEVLFLSVRHTGEEVESFADCLNKLL